MEAKTLIIGLTLLLSLGGVSVCWGADKPLSTSKEVIAEDDGDRGISCKKLEQAHAALLKGCFSARRAFAVRLNDKPVRRELVQVRYAAGDLTVDVIEEEVFDKRIEIDGMGDMVAESTFSCERMTRNADGRYALESTEDPERIIFDFDEINDVLLPLRWEFKEKARFLFKKFHIQAQADYSEVTFKRCDAESVSSVSPDQSVTVQSGPK